LKDYPTVLAFVSCQVIATRHAVESSRDCELNNLWGGCLTRPDGQDARPTKITSYSIPIPDWIFDYFSCNAVKRPLRGRFTAHLVLALIFPEVLT
jgi:hypothetical protein